MDQDQEAFLQAVCETIIAAARDSSLVQTSVGYAPPESVIPGEYINGWYSSDYEQNPGTLVPVVENPEVNPVNSGWYDLVTPPICQGSLVLEDKQKGGWLCSGCRISFRSKYEAKRHIDTAGMEVRCRYCDKVVNGTTFVLSRHVKGNSRCKRTWKERGVTGERTVDGAFRA